MASVPSGMGTDMNPYLAYRPSGVEWLGDVPQHWGVWRLKDVGHLIAGAAFPEALQGVEGEELPFFKVADLDKSRDGRRLEDPEHTISRKAAAEIRARVIPQESVVYAKIGAALLLNRRRVNTGPACIDNNMSAYVPDRDRITTHWALYTLSLLDFGEHVNPGAVPSLSEGDQAILPLPIPPLDEQRAIAEYLDRETERIDALVAKMRLLIERLQEHRTALITRAVTRGLPSDAARAVGLDPSPRLKPSGVEWLGEVPEHWEVKRLEHVASYQTSSVDKKVEEGQIPVRLCNYTDVYYQDRIRASRGGFMEATATRREIARFRLEPGDVVITKDSEDWQDIGVPALVDETADDFVCGYHLGIIRPRPVLHPSFLFRLMQSGAVNQRLQTSASGVTRYGLPNSAVSDVSAAPRGHQDPARSMSNARSPRSSTRRRSASIELVLRRWGCSLSGCRSTGPRSSLLLSRARSMCGSRSRPMAPDGREVLCWTWTGAI